MGGKAVAPASAPASAPMLAACMVCNHAAAIAPRYSLPLGNGLDSIVITPFTVFSVVGFCNHSQTAMAAFLLDTAKTSPVGTICTPSVLMDKARATVLFRLSVCATLQALRTSAKNGRYCPFCSAASVKSSALAFNSLDGARDCAASECAVLTLPDLRAHDKVAGVEMVAIALDMVLTFKKWRLVAGVRVRGSSASLHLQPERITTYKCSCVKQSYKYIREKHLNRLRVYPSKGML